MSETNDTVKITVDGVEMQAPKGAMLIEVTDEHDVHVPRFCYHDKLSVAANCRMCLVEVEKAPKPLPACATPVMDGMVVHTQSQLAREAQRSVMEFLLINHPLDCPICDQGGECELQDVAMAYGDDESEFLEGKRVVLDKSIGPLITTELTRCIHCTRCVRFGEEIAGIRELGMTSRGENARIATYMSQAVSSELSGNVIDLCPVGALTAKPSRYAGRSWEMLQHPLVAPHDCAGSNIYAHTLRGELMRVVPRQNEEINEVWLSDRDRFSYEATESEDRLTLPMIKQDGEWSETDWESALKFAANKLRALLAENANLEASAAEAAESEAGEEDEKPAEVEPNRIAALVSPNATLEEMYLAQKILRALGSNDIDHRLRQSDFSDQDDAPVMPWLGRSIASLEDVDTALLIGSNVRKEQPIIAHRLRKAAVQHGAHIHLVNTRKFDMNYEVASNLGVSPQHMVSEIAAIARACCDKSGKTPAANVSSLLDNAKPFDNHKAIADDLVAAQDACVILGTQAAMHANFAVLRQLAAVIAESTGADLGYLSDGANAQGAWLAGVLPHRLPGGDAVAEAGMHTEQILNDSPKAVMLLGVEPDADIADAGKALAMLDEADHVIAITAFTSEALEQVADVMLPAAAFTETSGTFANIEGYWQSFGGACQPPGESRPAWKILRVLGNHLGLEGFDYVSSEQVRDEVRAACEDIELDNSKVCNSALRVATDDADMERAGEVPMYACDALVRRAPALQQTIDAENIAVRINHHEAERLGLAEATTVLVKHLGDDSRVTSAQIDLVIDDSIPANTAWIPYAVKGNELLGAPVGKISLEAVN